MKALTAQEALITLYNSTRLAPLTLEQHDTNRACVDVLSQVLGIKLEWTVPTEGSDDQAAAPAEAEIASDEQLAPFKKNKKNKR